MGYAISITVLMACYNAERYVNEAIESVLTQSFGDFEFIIVDDGSEDRTPQILDEFAHRDSRIVLLRKQHTGLAASLNQGIQRARGEWIARIDADDICHPQRLHKQVSYVRRYGDIVFLGTGCEEIDEKGMVRKIHKYPPDHRSLLRRLERGMAFPPHSSAFFFKDAAKKVGCYRKQLKRAQDWDLWLRLSEVGKLSCLKDPLIQLRKHSQQVSLERGGIQQLVDGYAATVSHFLRLGGNEDPLASDPESVANYLRWIESRLKAEGVVEECRLWNEVRELLVGTGSRLAGMLRAVARLGGSRMALSLVRKRFLGTGLTKRLAREWVEYNKGQTLVKG